MRGEDLFLLGMFGLVAGLLIGIFIMIFTEMSNEQQSRLACINSGKSWVERSCVKVSP